MSHCISLTTQSFWLPLSCLWFDHYHVFWETVDLSSHLCFPCKKIRLGLRGLSSIVTGERHPVGSWDAYRDHHRCYICVMLVHDPNSSSLYKQVLKVTISIRNLNLGISKLENIIFLPFNLECVSQVLLGSFVIQKGAIFILIIKWNLCWG